jgi:hypothetical protein
MEIELVEGNAVNELPRNGLSAISRQLSARQQGTYSAQGSSRSSTGMRRVEKVLLGKRPEYQGFVRFANFLIALLREAMIF